MFAAEVTIVGQDHIYDIPGSPIIFSGRPDHPTTRIGHDVWIATRTTLLAGIEIGNGAIIGTGAVVTRNVGAYEIVAGTPARFVRYRFEGQQRDLHEAKLREVPTEGRYCEALVDTAARARDD